MKARRHLAFVAAVLAATVSGCANGSSATGDPDLDEIMASLEETIPGRDRASVRVCESLLDPANRIESFTDVLAFATEGLQELEGSDDPRGMKSALQAALIEVGDAAVVGDPVDYEQAVMGLATVCTDIVSGEYGT